MECILLWFSLSIWSSEWNYQTSWALNVFDDWKCYLWSKCFCICFTSCPRLDYSLSKSHCNSLRCYSHLILNLTSQGNSRILRACISCKSFCLAKPVCIPQSEQSWNQSSSSCIHVVLHDDCTVLYNSWIWQWMILNKNEIFFILSLLVWPGSCLIRKTITLDNQGQICIAHLDDCLQHMCLNID